MRYDDKNIFAKIIRGELPAEKVFENDESLVIMDIMPRSEGHMLVLTKTSCRNILDANVSQLNSCIQLVQRMSRAAIEAFAADGVTIQQFNETAGGQEVFHIHFHVLPRFNGVPLRPPGKMEDAAVLREHCKKIIAVLYEN